MAKFVEVRGGAVNLDLVARIDRGSGGRGPSRFLDAQGNVLGVVDDWYVPSEEGYDTIIPAAPGTVGIMAWWDAEGGAVCTEQRIIVGWGVISRDVVDPIPLGGVLDEGVLLVRQPDGALYASVWGEAYESLDGPDLADSLRRRAAKQ